MSGEGGDKSNGISILAFNVHGLRSRIENKKKKNFNLKNISEECKVNKQNEMKEEDKQSEEDLRLLLFRFLCFVEDEESVEDEEEREEEEEEDVEVVEGEEGEDEYEDEDEDEDEGEDEDDKIEGDKKNRRRKNEEGEGDVKSEEAKEEQQKKEQKKKECEKIEEDKKKKKTQDEKLVDIFLMFETLVTHKNKDPIITEWLEETEKKYELHSIPAQMPNEGYLFGCKRNTTKNFECEFVEVANHCVIKISSKKDKNTMPTFIIPVYINFKPPWKDNFEELKFTVSCLKDQNVLLIGDFNAWIGNEQILNKEQERNEDFLKTPRKSRHVKKNDRGQLLIKWCEEIGVTVLNGRTKSDEEGKFTRKSSTLDLCFVQGNLHQCVTDFEVMEERWGSDHHPIVVKAQLSFPKSTHILFTDLLAASTRPFEATGTAEKITESEEDKEKAEKSKELLEKFMGQMVYKKYIKNLSKMFAKIKDRQALHKLAKENVYFFGQNIKYETTIFVQNMEKLFRKVISKRLVDFQDPLEKDRVFDGYIISYSEDFESIVQSFLEAKNVLFAFIAHFDEFDLNSLQENALHFKTSAFWLRRSSKRPYLRILLASLEDYIPGGINWKNVNKKLLFYNDNCIILAETPTMIQRMIKKFMQYCDRWEITVDLKKSKLIVYENTGRTAYYQKFICGGQEIPRVIYLDYYESCLLNEMVNPKDVILQIFSDVVQAFYPKGQQTIWETQ